MAETLVLRAGPLRMRLENSELRYLTVAGQEVVRRVYAAVRDRNWGTVPGVLSQLQIAQAEDSFHVTFTSTHRRGEIDFAWQGTLSGDANGALRYHMDGAARKTFWKNRIGICVLIPPGCAGAAARILHADGQREDCRLPEQVSPLQPVPPFERLRAAGYQAGEDLWVDLGLEGDLFELEDQRNWSDASFKIYGTPLRQPYPVEIHSGTLVRQTVTVQVSGEKAHSSAAVTRVEGEPQGVLRLALEPERAFALPEIGLELAGDGQALAPREIQLLRALHPAHLRVDLDLTQPGWEERLALGAAQSQQLGAAMWLGLLLDENCQAALARAVEKVQALDTPPAAWIVLSKHESFWGGTPLAQVLAMAAPYLNAARPHILASGTRASGTRADLIFLLRSPVPPAAAGTVVFRITPQVHAFDDEALIESLGVQAAMIRSAQAAHPGAAVWVSPLSLRPGYNPYASAPPAPLQAGELPENVDPRQRELFAAAWTAGSLAALAEGGAGAVTAYETSGWRGVLEGASGSSRPERFSAQPGEVFPLYHVLADAGEFRRGEGLKISSSDGLQVLGLGLRKQGRLRVIAAYFGKSSGQVRLSGLPSGSWRLRMLDIKHLHAARFDPNAYRAESEAAQVQAGEIELDFEGVGTVTLDYEGP